MKAYELMGISDLRYIEVQKPILETGWVLVEVKAAGICGSDIPRIYETGTYHFPTIPGHEFSGIIREVFDEESKHLLGKRVGVFPLIPCKQCEHCLQEHYETCNNYNYLGSRTDGGFAEFVKVPIWNVLPLPDEISFEEAAMLEPISVALHAMKQINWMKNQSVVLHGIGPIGLMMAQLLRAKGIENIYLIGNKEQQLKLAKTLGFLNLCNAKTENVDAWLVEQTYGKGVSVAIEGVGTSESFSNCLRQVSAGGSVLLLANPKDNVHLEKNVFWQILRKQLAIFGTWNSRYGTTTDDNWKEVLELIYKKKIMVEPLITHRLEFDKLSDGLELMRHKKEFYCKVMLIR